MIGAYNIWFITWFEEAYNHGYSQALTVWTYYTLVIYTTFAAILVWYKNIHSFSHYKKTLSSGTKTSEFNNKRRDGKEVGKLFCVDENILSVDENKVKTFCGETEATNALPKGRSIRLQLEPIEISPLSWYCKVISVFFNLSSSLTLFVTIFYYSIIVPAKIERGLQNNVTSTYMYVDINTHAVTSVLMAIDIAVVAIPIQLYHVVYVIMFGVVYVGASAIWWSRDPDENTLYDPLLDWNFPQYPIIVSTASLFIVFPLLQGLLYLIYRVRLQIYFCLYGESYI